MKKFKSSIVITGAGKGIGKTMAEFFAEAGYFVVACSRTKSEYSAQNIIHSRMNAECENDHVLAAKKAIEITGSLTTYINCAGMSEWRPISKIDSVFLDKMTAVNLKGVFWGCKAAAKYLKQGGSIVNISSLAGKRGSSNNSAYCAVKFAVNGITQSLAKELGPAGIRVNAVCPVYVQTPGLIKALKSKYSPNAGTNIDKFLRSFAETNSALKRLPLAEEIAKACFFLASCEASAVTGQCINVDCGVMPQ